MFRWPPSRKTVGPVDRKGPSPSPWLALGPRLGLHPEDQLTLQRAQQPGMALLPRAQLQQPSMALLPRTKAERRRQRVRHGKGRRGRRMLRAPPGHKQEEHGR